MPKKILEPELEEITGHGENRIMGSFTKMLYGDDACIQNLIRKLKGKIPLERHRCRWMIFK
jgi:hypothetical protein